MVDKKHILLVDDEEEVVNFMENFLKRFKISSTKVISGEDALKIYEKGKYDFVFLDINMKGINGISVLKELRKRDSCVKIIMITANHDESFKEEALKLGAIDFISKPIDLSDFKCKIEKYVIGNWIE